MSPDIPAFPMIRTDPRTRAAYAEGAGIYRIIPAGVAVPASLADLRELINWASENRVGLIARGAGSGIPGNAVGSGVIVDLRERMPRRLEVDSGSKSATTSANVTQAELNRAAASYGLRLPPDPSSSAWATLGGMVSTNASGPRTVRYGPVRPCVQALEVSTADGEVGWMERTPHAPPPRLAALDRWRRDVAPLVKAAGETIHSRFPRTRKNTAGYPLDQWLASDQELDLLI